MSASAFPVVVDAVTQAELDAHTGDASDAHDASAISILDTANDFTATDVEAALAELQTADEADEAALAAHLADPTDAHDASAVSFTPTGTVAATDVQAAIAEVASEGAPYQRPAVSQRWYVPVPIYVATVTAPTQSRLLLSPMELPAGITLDRIAMNQFGGGVASCVFRMGIYSDVGTMYPGALLLDAGTVDLSTAAAVKSITIAQAISTPGVYWVGGVAQGAAPPTLLCIGSGAQEGEHRMPVDPATLFNKSVAFYEAGVTGALPANFTSTVNFTSTAATQVGVRVQ